MPEEAHTYGRVVLDASVFRRFEDAKQLILLPPYFQGAGVVAEIVREVHQELVRAGTTTTLKLQKWPDVVDLPHELRGDMLRRMRAARKPGDHELKNAGEIASVLYAKHVGATLVLAEDELAKTMCLPVNLNVPRLSTAHLVLEMACRGHLNYAQAWSVWDCATPPHVGESVFRRRLKDAGRPDLIPASRHDRPAIKRRAR